MASAEMEDEVEEEEDAGSSEAGAAGVEEDDGWSDMRDQTQPDRAAGGTSLSTGQDARCAVVFWTRYWLARVGRMRCLRYLRWVRYDPSTSQGPDGCVWVELTRQTQRDDLLGDTSLTLPGHTGRLPVVVVVWEVSVDVGWPKKDVPRYPLAGSPGRVSVETITACGRGQMPRLWVVGVWAA